MQLDLLTKQAITHTRHCLTGCAIGEITGMAISTALEWSNFANIALSIALAFFFGYLLTFRSLRRKAIDTKKAIKIAVATDSASITSMEIIDNLFIVMVPGAINAGLNNGLFWWSLAVSLVVAFIFTVPVNRWFIARSGMHEHMHH